MADDQKSNPIWDDDLLGGRHKHADFLESYLINRAKAVTGKSYVLNIDGSWGCGKSFFLKRFAEQLRANHIVAEIDAWKDDFADDPLLPVLHAIQEAIKPYQEHPELIDVVENVKHRGGAVLAAIGMGALKQAAKKVVGEQGVDEIFEAGFAGGVDTLFNFGEKETSAFLETRKLVESFIEALREFASSVSQIEGKEAPIFILIDELDRCRPTYAITLLERVKHIFSASRVVFVIATDSGQLQHSIRAVYGNGFDSTRYLHRFFDETYRLPSPTGKDLIKTEMLSHSVDMDQLYIGYDIDPADFIADLGSTLGLTARDLKRLVRTVCAAAAAKPYKSPIILPYFCWLSIAFDKADKELLSALIPLKANLNASHLFENLTSDQRLDFKIYRREYPRDNFLNIDARVLTTELIRILQHPLNALPRSDKETPNSGPSGWALHVLDNEFHINHGRTSYPGDQIPSVLLSYPDLISSAAQLLPDKDKLESEEE